ncbi:uncharacterized protein LOC122370494 [Amphibalanus amphitrite]|uniref:uncharacterized protein LOC122370494 n=1 Tax=Amphibalanus amphitrite TaxID=1232801 RepID=UPI001C928465|nr:uncharacterized protein LOC122370494 [Amphibalanus amphitrite]
MCIFWIKIQDHLKLIMSRLDIRDMFRARRVCRRWRSAVDDIVSDCRRELTDQKTRGGEVPAPATSLELVLKVQNQPKMTELQAPTAETDTDLRLVAATCHALEKANLRGFKLKASALRRLARANASSLRELTLPAGINDWQLEALLEPLKALERLDVSPPVDSSGKWLRLLPKSMRRLDITDPPVSELLPLMRAASTSPEGPKWSRKGSPDSDEEWGPSQSLRHSQRESDSTPIDSGSESDFRPVVKEEIKIEVTSPRVERPSSPSVSDDDPLSDKALQSLVKEEKFRPRSPSPSEDFLGFTEVDRDSACFMSNVKRDMLLGCPSDSEDSAEVFAEGEFMKSPVSS